MAHPDTWQCGQCEEYNLLTKVECTTCGAGPERWYCYSCGEFNLKTETHCIFCAEQSVDDYIRNNYRDLQNPLVPIVSGGVSPRNRVRVHSNFHSVRPVRPRPVLVDPRIYE